MWKFTAEQKQFEMGKVKIGGLPVENPTVLIGTIFYHGQKILRNEAAGDFDRDKAEELIKVQEEFSDKTGNPCMLDVVGASPEAIRKSVEFVASVTDIPIVIDGPTIARAHYCHHYHFFSDFNGLNPTHSLSLSMSTKWVLLLILSSLDLHIPLVSTRFHYLFSEGLRNSRMLSLFRKAQSLQYTFSINTYTPLMLTRSGSCS